MEASSAAYCSSSRHMLSKKGSSRASSYPIGCSSPPPNRFGFTRTVNEQAHESCRGGGRSRISSAPTTWPRQKCHSAAALLHTAAGGSVVAPPPRRRASCSPSSSGCSRCTSSRLGAPAPAPALAPAPAAAAAPASAPAASASTSMPTSVAASALWRPPARTASTSASRCTSLSPGAPRAGAARSTSATSVGVTAAHTPPHARGGLACCEASLASALLAATPTLTLKPSSAHAAHTQRTRSAHAAHAQRTRSARYVVVYYCCYYYCCLVRLRHLEAELREALGAQLACERECGEWVVRAAVDPSLVEGGRVLL